MSLKADLTPLVLLVSHDGTVSSSIEGLLRPKGHVVLKAHTGQQALDLIQKVSPDVIMTDVDLPDVDAIDLVRRFGEAGTVHTTTPMLLITHAPLGKAQRLDALGAGIWDILTQPIDENELILRIDTFARAKQGADRARDESLTDPQTGFYNVRGVLKRTQEMSADATRYSRPLTCIALGLPEELGEDVASRMAEALRGVTRVSDAIGLLGAGEYVIVAPGTNPDGAVRLADRVLERMQTQEGAGAGLGATLDRVRAGLCSVGPGDEASAEDLLLRATVALRKAQTEDGSFRVRAFEA